MTAPRIVGAGRHGVLVEVSSTGEATALAASLRASPLDGVEDVVGAQRTVLVRGSLPADALRAVVAERLSSMPRTAAAAPAGMVVVPVDYDGDDLAEVAARCGLGIDDVVAAHAGAVYTVAFCGFAPGFAYLTGLCAVLVLPRRATPRPRVPAGSVAVAGDLSAVYPTASPGGWHLLGRTDVTLFDPGRTPPALLAPGTTVRFEPR
ncbi:MAG: allophanate hydrolase subunit 1 [Ilumatobacteraceae bacterium]